MSESPSVDFQLRYPVGVFKAPEVVGSEEYKVWIAEIEALPENLEKSVSGLTDSQLDTPYRPGGWTARQVVHHLADSHLNSYQRFRLALTEDAPVIRTYDEKAWAELPDAKTAPVAVSVSLLRALHSRWTMLLRSLSESQWHRTLVHPERGSASVGVTCGLYAWHSRHHVAQIRKLRDREGW